MKKSLWIFLIVLLAGSIAFPLTLMAVDGEKESVQVRETVLFGNPEEAEGLRVVMGTHWDSRLLWETGYEPGKTEEADSSFSFYADQVFWKEEPAAVVNLEWRISYGTARAVDGNSGRTMEREIDISSEEIGPILQDVADRTEPGGEHTEILAVRDYFETYPAMMQVINEERNLYSPGFWSDRLAEIFDLRVPEDELKKVTVRKNSEGAVTSFQYSSYSGGYYLTGTSAFGSRGCFYGFRRESTEDYSIIDDGAGCWLYYLPYADKSGNYIASDKVENRRGRKALTINPDGIERVCVLPAGVAPVELVLDEGEKYLYLTARDDSRYYVFVYAVEGQELALRQQIPILEMEGDKPGEEGFRRDYRKMQVQEDGILITWGGNLFVFLAEREGEYRVWCSGAFPLPEKKAPDETTYERLAEVSVFADENAFAFDGERLALAAIDRQGDLSTRLLVYRDGQMVYSGFYEYSGELDKDFSTWELDCIQPQGAAGWGAWPHGGVVQSPLRISFEN